MLKGLKFLGAFGAEPPPPLILYFRVLLHFKHHWFNSGPLWHKIEPPNIEMLILNVREEIGDFSNFRTQKCVLLKWPLNAILVLFW